MGDLSPPFTPSLWLRELVSTLRQNPGTEVEVVGFFCTHGYLADMLERASSTANFAEAYALGVEKEKSLVVRVLRSRSAAGPSIDARKALSDAADAIEAGEHRQ